MYKKPSCTESFSFDNSKIFVIDFYGFFDLYEYFYKQT